mmetsp:Transcript_28590/g.25304  ORF Transcript_28590/g.25304 Transcript_28590/m.25304 type:complete len:107 (+) Transcript_28590:113-433(+)
MKIMNFNPYGPRELRPSLNNNSSVFPSSQSSYLEFSDNARAQYINLKKSINKFDKLMSMAFSNISHEMNSVRSFINNQNVEDLHKNYYTLNPNSLRKKQPQLINNF